MITIEKEETIRRLLKDGLTHRDIAARTLVSRTTVQTIRKMIGLRERKPKRKPPPANAKRLQEPRRCQTCGALLRIWPCVLCHPIVNNACKKELDSEKIAEAVAAESLELFRIVKDLQSLAELCRITDPLFTSLANRATKSLERIFP